MDILLSICPAFINLNYPLPLNWRYSSRHGSAWIEEVKMANEFSGSDWGGRAKRRVAVMVSILEEGRASVAEAA